MFDIGRDIDALTAESERAVLATTGAPRARATHLQAQLKALSLAARRLLGESMPFDAEATLGLGVNAARADLEQVVRARDALEQELPGTGALAERVSAFRRRFVVPEARREAVMRLALEQCRAATAAAMPLPGDESIDLAFVAGLPWDAHARYLGGHRTRIEVNASRPLDLARALRLACHEGYAGHHAQYIWTADELVTDPRVAGVRAGARASARTWCWPKAPRKPGPISPCPTSGASRSTAITWRRRRACGPPTSTAWRGSRSISRPSSS